MDKKNKLKRFWKKFWFVVWKDESPKGWIISIIFIFVAEFGDRDFSSFGNCRILQYVS